MFKRVSLSVILGLVGGIATFIIQELLVDNKAIMGGFGTALRESLKQSLIIGAVMCLFLGSAERLGRNDTRGALRQAGLAALYGLPGGFITLNLSNALYTLLSNLLGNPVVHGQAGLGGYALDLVPRAFGWMVLGAGLGFTASYPGGSSRRNWHATVGGALGGVVAGVLFVVLSMTLGSMVAGLAGRPNEVTEVGVFGRAVGFTVIGGAVGLLMSLMKEMLKSAWIEVILARNETQEFPIDKTRNMIGRSETADVPLYADPAIAPNQAAILWANGAFVLQNLNPQTLVSVNNGAPGGLKHGDVIRIGSYTLRFCEKKGRVPSAVLDKAKTAQKVLADPSGACPFCGKIPDAKTGQCQCSATTAPQPMLPASTTGANVNAAAEIRIVNGALSGQVLRLQQAVAIGRDASCQLQLTEDTLVSRRHARLEPRNAAWVVIDEGSSNGTFVNGSRVQESAIKPGDILTIGQTTLQVG
ncbi:MAG: FHA domain-containing protein [Armatimonadota bacterium]